jgi:excisionase family DNA binding protein
MGEIPRMQVSIPEAAEALGVCTQTIYRMRADGQIKITKTRGRSFVPMSELERLVSGGTQPTGRTPGRTPVNRRVKKRLLIPMVT